MGGDFIMVVLAVLVLLWGISVVALRDGFEAIVFLLWGISYVSDAVLVELVELIEIVFVLAEIARSHVVKYYKLSFITSSIKSSIIKIITFLP